MTNLQIVREAVIKAVPEVMEPALRKGVLCLVSNHGERYVTSYDVAVHDDALELLQVIGRPITLSDVLIALKSWHDKQDPFEIGNWTELQGTVCDHWNLHKTLNDQPDETLAFLAPLFT